MAGARDERRDETRRDSAGRITSVAQGGGRRMRPREERGILDIKLKQVVSSAVVCYS
jgi:hypothetical protein